MVSIYVTTREKGSGSTSVCAALGRLLMQKGKKPGYLKPVLSRTQDYDAAFMKNILSLEEPAETLAPAVSPENITDVIKRALEKISLGKDTVLIEGLPDFYNQSGEIAGKLKARLLVVEPYSRNISQTIVKLKGFGQPLLGVLFNKVPGSRLAEVEGETAGQIEKTGIKFLGVIPEDRSLCALTLGELAECTGGEILRGQDRIEDTMESFMLGAMTVDSGTEYFGRRKNKAAIIRSERPDMQLAAMSTSTRCLVLTGGKPPLQAVMLKAEEKEIPVVSAGGTTAEVMDEIEYAVSCSKMNRESKLTRFMDLMKLHVKLDTLYRDAGL